MIQIISIVNHVQAIFSMGVKIPMKVFLQNDLSIASTYHSVPGKHTTHMILLVHWGRGTMSVCQFMAVM